MTGPSKPTTRACQAYLVAFDSGTEIYLADRPCAGGNLRNVPLLTSDRRSQNGKFTVDPHGHARGFMRRKHNELYKARTTELKCHRGDCFSNGILPIILGSKWRDTPRIFKKGMSTTIGLRLRLLVSWREKATSKECENYTVFLCRFGHRG